MKVFFNPAQTESATGGLAVIPDGSTGGRMIEALVAAGRASVIDASEFLPALSRSAVKTHIEAGHVRVDETNGGLYLLDESEWQETLPRELDQNSDEAELVDIQNLIKAKTDEDDEEGGGS